MECFSAIKRNEILPLGTWMDLESIMLSAIIQTEKDKYPEFTHMWNLNKQKQVSKKMQNRDTSIESKLMMDVKEEVDGVMEIKKNK